MADRLYGGLGGTGSQIGGSFGQGLTRPTSETNLRQLAYGDVPVSVAARPGSALGLLQGSSIVSANGLRSTANLGLAGRSNYLSNSASSLLASVKNEQAKQDQSLTESLAAILPPDLRHLLGTSAVTSTTATTSDSSAILNAVSGRFKWNSMRKLDASLQQGGIRTAVLEDLRGSPLTRRRALEEELMRLTDDRSRLRTEKDRERELRIRRELEKYAALRDPIKRY